MGKNIHFHITERVLEYILPGNKLYAFFHDYTQQLCCGNAPLDKFVDGCCIFQVQKILMQSVCKLWNDSVNEYSVETPLLTILRIDTTFSKSQTVMKI